MTNRQQSVKPIPVLVGELNRHLKGWMNYFSFGYPSSVYCEIERYVRDRLIQHLQRRSQRPYRPPQGEGWLQHLARLGLIRVGPKYSCGTGVELQQASEPLVAVDLSALLPNQRRQ